MPLLSSSSINFTAKESNGRQTFKWMNSIKFIASLLAKHSEKHWTYQTLNECINAVVNVVICRSKNINQHADVVDIKFFVKLFRRKEWADRQTVDE